MRQDLQTNADLIDRLDNLANALKMPLPDSMHVEQLRDALPEIVEQLKASFVNLSGVNPWK